MRLKVSYNGEKGKTVELPPVCAGPLFKCPLMSLFLLYSQELLTSEDKAVTPDHLMSLVGNWGSKE
jgi:hypothetical protein